MLYTQQLNGQENRLETIRAESKKLEREKTAAEPVLDKMIQELSFDERM